jgi:hypothetical protein
MTLTPLASVPPSLGRERAGTYNGGMAAVSIRSSGHGVIECWCELQDEGRPPNAANAEPDLLVLRCNYVVSKRHHRDA